MPCCDRVSIIADGKEREKTSLDIKETSFVPVFPLLLLGGDAAVLQRNSMNQNLFHSEFIHLWRDEINRNNNTTWKSQMSSAVMKFFSLHRDCVV